MTFFGERRWAEDAHPHESPRVMTVPLIVLGVLLAGRRRRSCILGNRLVGLARAGGRRAGRAPARR